jgi:hypothetical protein
MLLIAGLITYSIPKGSGTKYRIIKKPREIHNDLICSDNPIYYQTIEEAFSTNETRFFPLTREFILVSSKEEVDITTTDFYNFQSMVFQSATKWVFASTPDTLKRIKIEVQHPQNPLSAIQ